VSGMGYIRPKSDISLTKGEKVELLKEYFDYYKELATRDINELNKKIPREALSSFLDIVGTMLLEESKKMSTEEGIVKEFLNENPLPPHLDGLLPKDFRVFCLLLNALKQWISAEQQATDRYLLGGTARETCRSISNVCIVTGEELGEGAELHHPIRDGRPPILLSKKGHNLIEGQSSSKESYTDGDKDDIYSLLLKIKHERNRSWVQLRKGIQSQLERPVEFSSKGVKSISRSFAKTAKDKTKLTYEELLQWMDENKLGYE
jgi:hypothetical protein